MPTPSPRRPRLHNPKLVRQERVRVYRRVVAGDITIDEGERLPETEPSNDWHPEEC